VQGAARAFSEGQSAQLRGENARAAEFFELADRLAPSPAALRSAIRMRRAAGQHAEAATLALRALERYAADAEVRRVAEEALGEAPRLARLRIACAGDPCGLTIDGRAVGVAAVQRLEIFVNPGTHVVRATWDAGGETQQSVDAVVGGDVALELSPPPRADPVPDPVPDPDPDPATDPVTDPATDPAAATDPATDTDPDPDRAPLSPAIFWTGLALTVVVGGIATWSGLDTLTARDEYEEMPTLERYEDGTSLETRTNILIVAAGVLGVGTVIAAMFTDFGGEAGTSQESLAGGAWLAPDGGGLQLRGGF
jgi:hypothetical protein